MWNKENGCGSRCTFLHVYTRAYRHVCSNYAHIRSIVLTVFFTEKFHTKMPGHQFVVAVIAE